MDPQASPDPLHPHFCEASAPPPRTIICCFDGTGNEFTSKENTNVVRLFTALKKGDTKHQLVFYLPGVGTTAGGLTSRITWQDAQIIMFSMTYFALIWALSILYKLFVKSEHDDDDYRGMTICCLISVGVAIPWMLSWVTSMLDLAIASNLDSHVKLGYIFIMNNYREGDKICLFGFSRGASTARVLAGMIYKVGLLPPQNDQLVDYAYKIFHAKGTRGHHLCMKFKKECCDSVIVDFVGVWDTVSRVGIFPRQATYFTCPTYGIRIFRHALALDERRVQFQANTWADPAPDSGIDINIDPPKSTTQQSAQQVIADIQEVWFPGGHCDVGGGLQDQLGQRDLSLISFQWMIKECFANITGILFDYAHLTALGVDLHQIAQELRLQPIDLVQLGLDEEMLSLNTQHQIAARFPGHDGAPEIWDELNRTRLWWIAECFANYRQEEYLLGMKGTGVPNLGRGRYIPLDGEVVRVHSSVKLMPKDYKPRAYNWDIVKDYIQWVD